MSGTKAGGAKAAATNKSKFGDDFYSKIGSKGGAASGTGGFYYSKVNGLDFHKLAGAKGGAISRRTKKPAWTITDEDNFAEGFNKPTVGERR